MNALSHRANLPRDAILPRYATLSHFLSRQDKASEL